MKQTRTGLLAGVSAYVLWGSFPFYFSLIMIVSPFEVVSWRVTMTLVFCALATSILRRWKQTLGVLKNRRVWPWLLLSSLLLYINWQLFVIGVMTGHVLETSLGYFINPLFTVLLGVFVRKETLSRLQWIAIAVAGLGLAVMTIGYGSVPWIALGLATSFGLYGAVHKHVGHAVDGLTGLTVETMLSTPIAVIQGIVLALVTGLTAYTHGPGLFLLVLASGVLTAIPLILFGESASRLPLIYIGFLQFITPILSFLYGFFFTNETMSSARWMGFISVWIALILLITNMVLEYRRRPGIAQDIVAA